MILAKPDIEIAIAKEKLEYENDKRIFLSKQVLSDFKSHSFDISNFVY